MTTLTAWLVTLVVFQPLLASVLVALLPQNEKRLEHHQRDEPGGERGHRSTQVRTTPMEISKPTAMTVA